MYPIDNVVEYLASTGRAKVTESADFCRIDSNLPGRCFTIRFVKSHQTVELRVIPEIQEALISRSMSTRLFTNERQFRMRPIRPEGKRLQSDQRRQLTNPENSRKRAVPEPMAVYQPPRY